MTVMTTEQLAQAWVKALSDVDAFPALCGPECLVWHSNDNARVTVEEAVANVHAAGGLPPMRDQSYTSLKTGSSCSSRPPGRAPRSTTSSW